MALHLGTEPAPGEVARAVATARELMEFAASKSATLQTLAGRGPLRAVGQLVGIAAIADALAAADEALQGEQFSEATDKVAVALELAFHRMEPPLLQEHRRRVNFSLRVQEFMDLNDFLTSIDRHVDRVEEWMLAVATGFRPAELRELRLFLGHVIFYSGGNIEVRRGESVELSPSDVHRATLQVAGVIFRLWQTGSLKPDRPRGDPT
jgi:integrase